LFGLVDDAMDSDEATSPAVFRDRGFRHWWCDRAVRLSSLESHHLATAPSSCGSLPRS